MGQECWNLTVHAPNSPGVRSVLCCDRVAHGKGGTLAPGGVAWGPVRPEAWCGGEEQTRGGRRGSEEAEERAERRGVSSHARRKKEAWGGQLGSRSATGRLRRA